MSCTKINNGIVCSGTVKVQEIMMVDGTVLWFEVHKYFGAFFWADEGCMIEVDWVDVKELCEIVDNHYKPSVVTLDDL